MSKLSPLKEIRLSRNLTLRELYLKINQEIKLTRLSNINVCREIITPEEIDILKKYLDLTVEEIKALENMQENKELKEVGEYLINLLRLVPDDLKKGEQVIKECPKCGANLTISRAKSNGHLWIVCDKEGVLLMS